MSRSWVGLAAGLLLAASSASAQEPVGQAPGAAPAVSAQPAPPTSAPLPVTPPPSAPSSGLLLLLAGSGLTIGGVGNLALAPLCATSKVRADVHGQCLGLSLAFGVTLLGAGIPLLVLGARQREVWKQWTQSTRVGVVPGGAAATWSRSW